MKTQRIKRKPKPKCKTKKGNKEPKRLTKSRKLLVNKFKWYLLQSYKMNKMLETVLNLMNFELC